MSKGGTNPSQHHFCTIQHLANLLICYLTATGVGSLHYHLLVYYNHYVTNWSVVLGCITVKPLIMDTPNNGHLPYNGQWSIYQPLFLSQYVLCSRIADNLRILDNGQGSCTTRLFSIEVHLPIRVKWVGLSSSYVAYP